MTVPYTFASATSAIPLSQLDSNFATPITLGNTAIQLGNTVTTLNNMTLANVTISSGSITNTNVSITNVAYINVAQTFTTSQRDTVTTDNDGSFDMNATNNFKCTPTATFALTFTNITAGQSGYVLLVNTGGYAVTAAATTKVGASFLSTVSAAGTYLVSYFSDGTNVYCTASGALS